ncbi:SCAN domain-containing protein 3 [Trichinella nelsoni]|uniref:SCAN domain-containing protein 3 n=1 Tax=Trichinella nelsoni TaxID=6336 RepID=A0A0V0SFY6_9BILA|nr:SCAN domain-containing protein 3 [Trichinella nelsoni]
MKPSKMKDHLGRVHPDKKNKDVEFFKVLKEKIRNQPNLKSFFKAPGTVDCEGGLKASYTISLNIAKKAQSYTIGEEIVIPAIKEVIETVMKKDSEPVLKCIPLSATRVQRRIDEMASDVEKILVSELQHSKFSIQLDESAFGCSNVLMAYVRYYSQSLKCIADEFLFANYLKGDAKGETIFRSLEDYLKEHNVPLRNITAVATDGAPAMVGRYRGFATLLKETVPDVRAVHCVLHRHHLVAKNLSGELHAALKVCIKAVNKIKGQPLNSRLFATLCEKNDETFNQLLFHTEVRWLSRGDCLQRLVDLYHSTVEFLADVDQTLCEELKKCKNHLFYLADLYSKFNEIQKRLQGKDVTIIQARTLLIGFQAKIGLFKSFLARRDFKYFSNLQKLEEGADVSDRDLEIYINHLEKLEEDFKIRFEDLESMTVPDWIIAPFDIQTGNANIEFSLQEEHVEMSADLEAKLLFKHKSLSEFWSNVNITNKYPKLSAAAQPFLLAFPSSYLVEAGFSHVNAILSKQRNRLNLEMRGDLRLKLTTFQSNINALAAAHQTHPSH